MERCGNELGTFLQRQPDAFRPLPGRHTPPGFDTVPGTVPVSG